MDATVSGQRYIPGVDGLRALAVTIVVAFHAGAFPLGWFGVWIFFVISGFVITRSLLSSEATPRPLGTALKDFYAKRFFRIIPLYALIIALAMIVTGVSGVLKDQYWPQFASLASFTFTFFRMWSGYIHSEMTGHLWSLSTEEHFYFLFPLLFLLVPRKRLVAVMVGVIVAAVFVRAGVHAIYENLTPVNPAIQTPNFRSTAVYQFSLGHFDAFAMGVILALCEKWVIARKNLFTQMIVVMIVAWAAYVLIIGTDPRYENPFMSIMMAYYRWGDVFLYTILSFSAAAAIVGVIRNVGWLSAPLKWKPVVFIGKISYGVYIFHLPVQFLLISTLFKDQPVFTDRIVAIGMFAASMPLTVAAATLSFYFFERPMQRLRPKARPASPTTQPAAAASESASA